MTDEDNQISGPETRASRKKAGKGRREDYGDDMTDAYSTTSRQTLVSDSGLMGSDASKVPTSAMENVLTMMAQMMADNQRREERRLEESRKEEQKREERMLAEVQKREELVRAEEQKRDERIREEVRRREERDDSRRQEEARRERAEEEKKRMLEEFQQRQLELMMKMREDDAERQREQQDRDREWKELREKEKTKEARISSVLRSFPKIGSINLLPTQLNNYHKLLSDLEASSETMITRLPEVLSGAAATTFQNLTKTKISSFADLKERFLNAAGLTFSMAGKSFIKPDVDALKKMSAVDLWCYLKGVVQRLLAGASNLSEVVSVLCTVFLNVFGNSNLVLSLANISPLKEDEVSGALFRTFEAFGNVISDDFKRRGDTKQKSKCEHCGKSGHRSSDCWSKPKAKSLTCFVCSKEGHISTNCPERVSNSSGNDGNASTNKPGNPGKKKSVWNKNSVVREPNGDGDDSMMSVSVGGQSLRVLPDSGAQVSVFPPAFVAEREFTGESTRLVDFEGQGDRERRIALVDVRVGETVFRERVAVSDHLGNKGILSLPILDESKSFCILSEFYRQRHDAVCSVQTRSVTRRLNEEAVREEAVMAEEAAVLRDVRDGVLGERDEVKDDLMFSEEEVHDVSVHEGVHDMNVHEEVREDVLNNIVSQSDVNVRDTSKPVSTEEGSRSVRAESSESVSTSKPVSTEEGSRSVRAESRVTSETESNSKPVSTEGVSRSVSAENACEQTQLDCLMGGTDHEEMVENVKSDPSLAACRRLASQRERGYFWESGLLLHKYLDELGEIVTRVVVPKQKRSIVCKLAHDRMGHLGHRKIREFLGKRFTWPRIGQDLEEYVRSCTSCQLSSKRGQRKVPMVERPILSEPFEAVAIDLVGPFPLAKGRFRYLLTSICLATRWPDVVTLKTVTAKAVADGLLSIFSRTGLPYVLLCDNGSQFSGKLMKELSEILGIEVNHSSPYHPESNGLIERMHATLGSMLRKASERKLDWAEQVPFALFALRQMPCRTTGLSPYELVWGSRMRTPLDILYRGWREKRGKGLNVSEWTMKLCDKLDVLRDVAVSNAKGESEKRKNAYDRGKTERSYVLGDRVLVRVAGKDGKLADSWDGPYTVSKILSAVNYQVKRDDNGKKRKVHVNLCKTFRVREKIAGVTVLAEESNDDSGSGAVLCGNTDRKVFGQVKEVLKEFEDLMNGEPGVFKGKPLSISVVHGAEPVSSKPYRIPEAVKPKVKDALDALIERGWVVPSSSPWASPIVPVAKPDGSVRLCVNYKVNEVTHQKQFPIPHFEDILLDVGKAKILSKMDLMKGYHQVPLDTACQDLTGFVTPWGCFKYTVLPFGLKNAPAEFQELMSAVLSGCSKFALVYIDDVLVYSTNGDEHAGHVREVLKAIEKSGLRLNPKKCVWAKTQVEFLGHVVGEGKVSVPEARVKHLRDFRKPVTRRDLRAALGTFGYYRRFVKNYADITDPLTQSTSSKAPHKVVWTPEMDSAFVSLRCVISDVCCLFVPIEGDQFVLHTDASGRGVGAVLYVRRAREELPVAFYSRQLRDAERRYSATELEALAMVASIEHFVPYLYGRRFDVVTDHAPLVSLMSSTHLNRRLRNFMLKLLEFDLYIHYRPGIENGDADGLSRQAWECQDDRSVPAVVVPSVDSGNLRLSGGDVGTPTHTKTERTSAPPPSRTCAD